MKNTKCKCHGYETANEKILPHQRRQSGIKVCPDLALKSSLSQLGSGIQLTKEQSKEFMKKVLNK